MAKDFEAEASQNAAEWRWGTSKENGWWSVWRARCGVVITVAKDLDEDEADGVLRIAESEFAEGCRFALMMHECEVNP